MISLFVVFTQLIIAVLFLGLLLRIYYMGFRHGVRVIARAEIEGEVGERLVADVQRDYVNEQRAFINDVAYMQWAKAHSLPMTADTRALFNNPDFRAGLEAQAKEATQYVN